MRFARRDAEEPSINLAPLIDVVFLLLIFFMVSTQFIGEDRLSLQLPAASEAERSTATTPLQVVVDARNRYYVDGEAVAAEQLARVLAQRHAAQPRRTLVLRADGRATHQAVVRVLDVAAGQGFASVDIAVRAKGD